MKLYSKSVEDTEKIGLFIGKNLNAGTVICLEGDLGAGKTTLTQAIATGLEVEEYVTSPTFTIIKEYEGRLRLYHMDAYRLESEEEMSDLGYEEYIHSNGVCIIEWGSKIKDIIPGNAIFIYIEVDYSTGYRTITVEGDNSLVDNMKEELKEYEDIRN